MSRWKNIERNINNIIVWGASDQCRINYPILNDLGYKIEALIDDTVDKKSPFSSIPIYIGDIGLQNFIDHNKLKNLGFAIAIANPYGHIRVKIHAKLVSKGFLPISFSDQTAHICNSVIFGEGLQVMPSAIIENDVKISTQCIIGTRALVMHDCILGQGVEIGPGSVVCGRVTIGNNSWVGAGAVIKDRLNIGSNTIIGAGAVVVSDIPDGVIVAGVPAKIIKKNSHV